MGGSDFLICGRCGGPIDPGVRRCPYCGASAAGARSPAEATPVSRSGDAPVLAAPPRTVPVSLVIGSTFGNGMSVFGWILAGIGMILVLALGCNSDLGPLMSWAYTGQAQGITVGHRETNWTVGGGEDEPGTPIYATIYQFRTQKGEVQSGEAFATGKMLDPGITVEVRYVPGRPSMSRIEGMRNAPLPFGLLAVLLALLLIGLYCSRIGFQRGLKTLYLLREGVLGAARLESKEATNVSINDRVVMKLTFAYVDESGLEHEVATRTYRPEDLEDDEEEAVVYDPGDPERAITLDNLPGSVRIGEDGGFAVESPGRAYLSLVMPSITVALILLGLILFIT